jgi:hypothetical protein
MKLDGKLSSFCLTSPALVLDATLHPARFGSVASCYSGAFAKAAPKVRKNRDRLQPSED